MGKTYIKQVFNDYGAILVLLLLFIILFLSSCTKTITDVVEVPKVHTEYVYSNTIDSIYIQDSIYINQYIKGDTVYCDKALYKYKTKYKTTNDTIIKIDSVTPPSVIKELMKYKQDITTATATISAKDKTINTYRYLLLVALGLLAITNAKRIYSIIKTLV